MSEYQQVSAACLLAIFHLIIKNISPDLSTVFQVVYQLYSLSEQKLYFPKKRFSVVLVLPKILNPCISLFCHGLRIWQPANSSWQVLTYGMKLFTGPKITHPNNNR